MVPSVALLVFTITVDKEEAEDWFAALAYALPALEIVDSAIADWKLSLVDTVADNASCGLYVLGNQPVSLGQLELGELGLQLDRNGRTESLGSGVVVGAGAKVLGPITLGQGAKVGSNAVVVRDVPPGATAVGIPARIVEDRSEIDREVKAGQMGFSAYAVTRGEDDPLAQAIHGLLDHAVETDRRIEALLKTMARSGVSLEDDVATADKFDPNYLSKIVD